VGQRGDSDGTAIDKLYADSADFITPVSPVTSAGKYQLVAMAKSSVTALTNALGQRPRDISGPLWDLQSTNPVPVKVRCALTQT
jgi:hypothetical protein